MFIIALIQRVTVDPEKVRELKKDMNYYRKKMKSAQKEKDTKRVEEYGNAMMKLSSKQFRMNSKPMISSFVIFFFAIYVILGNYGIILPFLNTPTGGILVNTDPIDSNAYSGTIQYKDFSYPLKAFNESDEFKVVIDYDRNGFSDDKIYKIGDIIEIGRTKWKVYSITPNQTHFIVALKIPFPIPFFGRQLDWFWWYVLTALPASFIFRKLLGAE
jgi:uncharacterized membrane protein (DUF106 family)